MITKEQLSELTKQKKINETVVFREYLQLLFLNKLYSQKESKYIFFKGGTALRLIYKATRFSEDLDFTVETSEKDFLNFIFKFFNSFSKKEDIAFKERKTLAGKRFLLTASPTILPQKSFVNLDFSFREKVLDPQKSIVDNNYPIIFTDYIYHFSKEEILAEKIRALLTRKQGRDMYDLWFLLSKGTKLKKKLIKEKLKYYEKKDLKQEDLVKRIEEFDRESFIKDMRPLVPINEREKLGDFFNYVKDFLIQRF